MDEAAALRRNSDLEGELGAEPLRGPFADPLRAKGTGDELGARLAAERPRLIGFLLRLAGSTPRGFEAEDIVQEVFARVLHYRSFDPARPLGPWLRRAAFHAFLDNVRRQRRAPDPLSEDPTDPAGEVPHAALDQREHVARLLAPLGPLERDLLLGFHREGRSLAELADAHRMPLGTIKSHLSRARRKLASRQNPAPRKASDDS